MTTHTRLRRFAAAMMFALPLLAAAAEPLIFDSCLDARGNSIPAVADAAQTMLVRGDSEQGRTVIRYNPEVLPDLAPASRLFFYAHQCARSGLPAQANPAAAAAQADCLGLGSLLASKLLRPEDIPALQAGLAFNDGEWARLPGPPRQFDLAGCRVSSSGVLRLPLATPPSPSQSAWNTCTRTCGDRLWTCQKQCGHADCERRINAFSTCKQACGEGPTRTPAH